MTHLPVQCRLFLVKHLWSSDNSLGNTRTLSCVNVIVEQPRNSGFMGELTPLFVIAIVMLTKHICSISFHPERENQQVIFRMKLVLVDASRLRFLFSRKAKKRERKSPSPGSTWPQNTT